MMENHNSKKNWFSEKKQIKYKNKICEKKCHILYLFLNNRILLIFL